MRTFIYVFSFQYYINKCNAIEEKSGERITGLATINKIYHS